MALALGVASCDRLKRNDTKTVRRQSTSKPDAQRSAPPAQVRVEAESSEVADAERRASLPKGEYGKENPFEPIVAPAARRSAAKTKPPPAAARIEESKPEKKIVIRLSAILGNTAIMLVDGSSQSVSVGDTIAGLKVLSVGESKVVLEKGDETFTVTLETEIEVKPANPGKG